MPSDRLDAAEPPRVPEVEALQPLAAGGQGQVYAGTWRGRRVAVRVQALADSEREAARVRAEQEGRLLAGLHHANLVPLLAHGTTERHSYVVMEFVAGVDLERELARRAGAEAPEACPADGGLSGLATRILPPDQQAALLAGAMPAPEPLQRDAHWRWVGRLGVEVCGALDVLHSAGLLHRDVKPRNIMIRPDGSSVLVDLGLATAGDLVRVQRDSAHAGTWPYMSPEQRQGQGVSTRSDIFGLGCTLYQCLTGSIPRTTAGDTATAAPVAPPDVRAANPAVPATLAQIVERCLQPLPGDRYLSARALADDLRAVLAGKPLGWRPPVRRGRGLIALGGAGALALAAWLAFPRPDLAPLLAALRGGDQSEATAILERTVDRARLLEQVAAALSPTEVEAQRLFAKLAGFGLIECEACEHQRIGATVSNLDYSGGVREHWHARQELAFALPPGVCKVEVIDQRPEFAWGPDDPGSHVLLVRVRTGAVTRIPGPLLADAQSRLGWFRTATAADWWPLPAGTHTVWSGVGRASAEAMDWEQEPGVLLHHRELGRNVVRLYLDWLRRDLGRLAWFAHPDEPSGACGEAALPALRAACELDDPRPAQVSFWWAHRIATFCGCRLPRIQEWALAAQLAYARDPGAAGGRPPAPPYAEPAELLPCGGPDPHPGATPLAHLLGNAREWTCTLSTRHGGSALAPVGTYRTATGRIRTVCTNEPGEDDHAPLDSTTAGIRLARHRAGS